MLVEGICHDDGLNHILFVREFSQFLGLFRSHFVDGLAFFCVKHELSVALCFASENVRVSQSRSERFSSNTAEVWIAM